MGFPKSMTMISALPRRSGMKSAVFYFMFRFSFSLLELFAFDQLFEIFFNVWEDVALCLKKVPFGLNR